MVAVLFSLSWLVGMSLYVVYRQCDPLAAGHIAGMDEVLPYYVQDHFAWLPGMLGLFLGSLFNGALRYESGCSNLYEYTYVQEASIR